MTERLVSQARTLAIRAHEHQRDKAGRPYIEHVARVAAAVAGDDRAEAVAWLHDVVEDCPDHAAEVQWWPEDIRQAVMLLTRGEGDDAGYYLRIRDNPLALKVKLADIADNSSHARLEVLDAPTAERLRIKYANALKVLQAG